MYRSYRQIQWNIHGLCIDILYIYVIFKYVCDYSTFSKLQKFALLLYLSAYTELKACYLGNICNTSCIYIVVYFNLKNKRKSYIDCWQSIPFI